MRLAAAGPLPKFAAPPVSEVVFSVQFAPLSEMTPVHLGAWWDRERYPVCEQRPPIQRDAEEFGQAASPGFKLELMTGAPPWAVWMLTDDRRELLQVQRDRFTRNWTREPERDGYPSYDELAPRFMRDLADFTAFVQSAELGVLSVDQCELTYINPIPVGDVWQRPGQLERVLAPWSGVYTEGFLDEPESITLDLQYLIPGSDGRPTGRLRVSVKPALDRAQQTYLMLTMVARGRPEGLGAASTLSFFDVAHEWIVRGFTTLTTPPMHKVWRRTQ